ncbi:MAG TPA: DnaD domain protein [Clostridiales bacterium]|nr:DnaD domain protein [Clostridiales bacterium]
MNYKINPLALTSCFVIPTSIVDKHIKLAGATSLKVLLWLYRHLDKKFDLVQITADLGISPAEIEDALDYWIDAGLVMKSDSAEFINISAETKEDTSEKGTPENTSKTNIEIPIIKPTQAQIALRCAEDTGLSHLFREYQKISGKTVGYDTQATLLMINDAYGLPCDVILMLVHYAKSKGRLNMNFIKTLSKDWGNRGITTVDEAAQLITTYEDLDTAWSKFVDNVGFEQKKPSPKIKAMFEKWYITYNFSIEIISAAYYKMFDSIGKYQINYWDKILADWYQKGIITLNDVEKEATVSKNHLNKNSSYDLKQAEEHTSKVPKFRKKD